MPRLTKRLPGQDGHFVDASSVTHSSERCGGAAIDRLARFEDVLEDLSASQAAVVAELEKLRSEGKTKSVRFKQLVANKLMNTSLIALFQSHGLKD